VRENGEPESGDRSRRKGWTYTVTAEQIERWMAVPFAEKIRWLDEATDLVNALQSPWAREMMRRFRAGEIGDSATGALD
jgi:hypothetical protein